MTSCIRKNTGEYSSFIVKSLSFLFKQTQLQEIIMQFREINPSPRLRSIF